MPDLSFQGSLFGAGDPAGPSVDTGFGGMQRIDLDGSAWVDLLPNWLVGADDVFTHLAAVLAWRQREVVMWDRLLPEPRLTWWWDRADAEREPLPVLGDVRRALTDRYERSFDTIGCNLYRDGHDSVSWHSDRERFHLENPVVAIVSTGSPRSFMMRPKGGGRSTTFRIGHGDLLVMGGSCQHDWEHCVPKSTRVTEPRLSIMFRHDLSGMAGALPPRHAVE